MKPVAVLALLLLPSTVFACLWVDGTTLDGRKSQASAVKIADQLRLVMAQKPADETATSMFGKNEKQTAPQSIEEKAVDKILGGETRLAIEMLQGLEAKNPGRYSTAANLGTAYELSGDNEDALKWISTGIQRNPKSHGGTEWLHVLILKAKIEGEKHPQQPLSARLLDLPERMTAATKILVDGQTYIVREIENALRHQLRERMLFVKPKDVFVADLLYSYALIQANVDSVESALELLILAREYGFADEALLKQHERQYAAVLAAKQRR